MACSPSTIGICDTEKLIIEIEKRPPLYDKNLPEFSIKAVRDRSWDEVYETMFENWDNLGQEDKNMPMIFLLF